MEKTNEELKKSLPDELLGDDDFDALLNVMLDAYRPIIEEALKQTQSPEELKKQAADVQPNCEEELALADRLFDCFADEKMALLMLDKNARETLGPVEKWPWCLRHIACCLKLGWLLNRAKTFKAAVYYLYRYWVCVRQALGTDLQDRPLSAEEKEDFNTLTRSFAAVYQPFLSGQLDAAAAPLDVAEQVIEGKIDCFAGIAESHRIFDHFLTPDLAPALFGKDFFEKFHQDPRFWFCRCWCLCAIKFGWCLGRAKHLLDVVRCLVDYWFCLRDCFQPLRCQVTAPDGCVEEDAFPTMGILRGVEIRGTATGAFCSHYELEWRQAGTTAWQTAGIRYAGSPEPSQGNCGIVNGTLGYLETFPMVAAGPVEIRLCVYSNQAGATPKCCQTLFELRRNLVWINAVEGIDTASPPGIFDPGAQLIDSGGQVRAFGTALKIFGSAWVGGCSGSTISRYTLSYIPGFVTDPLLPGFVQFWQVDYITPMQIDSDLNKVYERALTNRWRELNICFPNPTPPPAQTCFVAGNALSATRWSTQSPAVYPQIPPAPPNATWTSTPLPLSNCQSGKFTLRLTVEETGGAIKHDLQQVWVDNKDIHGKISQIQGLPTCGTINLSQFVGNDADCKLPWEANLLGIAYDEFIEEGNSSVPSDNFDEYRLWIRKDGGPWFPVPVPIHTAAGNSSASRVGDPGVRCTTAVPAPGSIPAETPGILTVLDMRRFDAVCNPSEPLLTLSRDECCGYIARLRVQDKTICPSLSADRHRVWDYFPFCICNDL